MRQGTQISDFGRKIGGARKDLWKQRGLIVDDLEAMNEREAAEYIKKDNIWCKPDYQSMIEGGLPVEVAYFIKRVRDSLDCRPRFYPSDDTAEKRLSRQKQYIETVREVMSFMQAVKSKNDVMGAAAGFLSRYGYMEIEARSRCVLTPKGKENPFITQKLCTALRVSSGYDYEKSLVKKAKKEQFGVPKEQKIPAGYDIIFHAGKSGGFSQGDWKAETYYVTRGRQILRFNFESRDEALRWVREYAAQHMDRKQKFVPKQLACVRRDGPDYRKGQDATAQEYLDVFGFRAGEFGNWTTQNDRRTSLNMGFDALMDLAVALKISDRDISYQGELAIAFGARGHGKAAAHYEPLRKVINLTKMHGAGALAHEWWHGLDDYLGEKMGTKSLLSENPRNYPLFVKLLKVMKYRLETAEEAAQREEKNRANRQRNAGSWADSLVLPTVKRSEDAKLLSEYAQLKAALLDGEPGAAEKLNQLKKSISGHVVPKDDREKLEYFERMLHISADRLPVQRMNIETEYYRASKKMGGIYEKDGGYWDSDEEMTARAFATYLMDRLPTRSDYLNGYAESAVGLICREGKPEEIVRAYPTGEERTAINAVFDEIFEDLKTRGYLTHDERLSVDSPTPLRMMEDPTTELATADDGQLTLAAFLPSNLNTPAGAGLAR